MAGEGSITHWIREVKDGDEHAAQMIWERYFERMVRLARVRLGTAPRRVADEEDVALAALNSFCLRAARGEFPRLVDRDGLWRLLVTMTARKALDQRKFDARLRRGGKRVHGGAPDPHANGNALEDVVGAEPTPEFAASVAEELERLLDALGDDSLRRVAIWKFEGYTNAEIAAKLGCSRRSVARKLTLTRRLIEERQTEERQTKERQTDESV